MKTKLPNIHDGSEAEQRAAKAATFANRSDAARWADPTAFQSPVIKANEAFDFDAGRILAEIEAAETMRWIGQRIDAVEALQLSTLGRAAA